MSSIAQIIYKSWEKIKKGTKISDKAHEIVGPVVGVTGVLIGLAKRRKNKGVILLAETDSHPLHLGVKGAKEILKILKQKLNLKINPSNISKEIKALEDELKKITKEIKFGGTVKKEETRYIG